MLAPKAIFHSHVGIQGAWFLLAVRLQPTQDKLHALSLYSSSHRKTERVGNNVMEMDFYCRDSITELAVSIDRIVQEHRHNLLTRDKVSLSEIIVLPASLFISSY